MGKKDRLSRDQRRKAKLAKEARHARKESSLAYTGNKYKKDEFTPLVFRTELGIYETYVMTDRKLTDRTVRSALEKLVGQLRHGPLSPQEDKEAIKYVEGQEDDLVIANIRRNWEILFETEPHWSRETQIGVLRTLLGSLEVWSSPGAQSRGYLHFIEGFMKKMGASVDVYSPDFERIPEKPEDALLEIGREWCEEGDQAAATAFCEKADQLIRSGQAERVVGVCQQLLGGLPDQKAVITLSALSLYAQEAIQKRLDQSANGPQITELNPEGAEE